jgi:hypothetical protein
MLLMISTILCCFYAIGLLLFFFFFPAIWGWGELLLTYNFSPFINAGWHTYFWIAFLPFIVSSLQMVPHSSFASHAHVHRFLYACLRCANSSYYETMERQYFMEEWDGIGRCLVKWLHNELKQFIWRNKWNNLKC